MSLDFGAYLSVDLRQQAKEHAAAWILIERRGTLGCLVTSLQPLNLPARVGGSWCVTCVFLSVSDAYIVSLDKVVANTIAKPSLRCGGGCICSAEATANSLSRGVAGWSC